MADAYGSMTDLLARLAPAGHYEIRRRDDRHSPVKLFAPHGGCIEPGTGELVTDLAGREFDYYVFRGMMKKNCYRTLHVTSTRYDEPSCAELVGQATLAVAVHGCAGAGRTIEIGGGNREAARALEVHLRNRGFPVAAAAARRRGSEARNFINGARLQGVQLELSAGFRTSLFPGFPSMLQRNHKLVGAFVDAVREWLVSVDRTPA